MSPPRELSQVQRWMQAVITHPGGVVPGIASSQARAQLDVSGDRVEMVITRSRAQTAIERLEIYAKAYYARLLECLRAEFPVLVHAMGADLFDEFAVGYLERYPSHSYTLNHLGANFAQYLEETRPEPRTSAPEWPEFLVDLARLEWAFSEVFDGPGAENEPLLDPAELRAIPPERWPDVRLKPVPCLRTLALRFPVNRYYRAVRRKRAARPAAPAETFLAVTRRDYVVRHYELTRSQHALLSAVVSGANVAEAIAAAADLAGGRGGALARWIGEWFRRWAAQGFFLAAELPT